ncbi:MAG TPA: SRPBCC family protein [Cyclobacteriaceae bacterium]|nr:SRPBCC family protein [Cyclobacteriaceae bacterium]
MQTSRIHQSGTIRLDAPIDKVFPLFGPIREKDWAHGWDPQVIYPKDTLVEKQMVFCTRGGLHGSTETYTWVVVNYEPNRSTIEYMVTASERLWFITVSCNPAGANTMATVTYSYTGLTEEGNRKNEVAIKDMFASNLKDWEAAINHYLKTGTQLH